MNNIVLHQWIVKQRYLMGDSSYRLIALVGSGDYYISTGEVGDFRKISKGEAEKMINRDI